jgi:hypothetical protein
MATKRKSKANNVVAPITDVPVVPEKTLEELRSEDMETRANALVDILGNSLPAIPKSFHYRMADVDRVKNSFDFTFSLIGGQPAFALWAAQNPGEFYKLYSRMLPQQNNVLNSSGPLTIITGVPDSPLDTPVGGGHIIDGDAQ